MQKIINAIQGIILEVIYALAIMLAAFIIGAIILFVLK